MPHLACKMRPFINLSALLLAAPLVSVHAFEFTKPDMSQPLDYTKPITIEWAWLEDGKEQGVYDRYTLLNITVVVEGPRVSATSEHRRVIIDELIATNFSTSKGQYDWDASRVPAKARAELSEGQEIENVYFKGIAWNPEDHSVPGNFWESEGTAKDSGSSANRMTVSVGALLSLGAAWLM
ncbi:hypothetical protein F5X68DRAFT_275069 [Plectosphaerella plurivora]|uniref:Uncharacterized protein n=1 Tax=Plectosphaerella plurivora TaxID=936078 RepID=A0A9P8VEB5_9PEZI|nr:hypothetical protein F5X68DRAFT_275069 [Plectosphaerella plurivora]